MKSEPKQIIVMRKDLNMRKGKMMAQASHASMKVLLDRMIKSGLHYHSGWESEWTLHLKEDEPLKIWLNGLFTKVVLSCDSEEELLALYKKAKDKGLLCSLITDAGLTEFNNVPTNTCIAIGPDFPENINDITGHLKLL